MSIEYIKTDLISLGTLLDEYLASLTGIADDFWEEHIIDASHYLIRINGKDEGCFAVHGGQRLSMFYLREEHTPLAQDIFGAVLKEYGIKYAFAVTCDSFMLSLCMDCMVSAEPQAYFFGYNRRTVPPPRYGRDALREIVPEELDRVKEAAGGFFSFVSSGSLKSGAHRLYALSDGRGDICYGIIVPGRLLREYWSCGMITLEERRRQGAGRSMLIHLADICEEQGAKPISGCWYRNYLSKKTIESSGRHSRTRLLNFIFREETDEQV